MYILKTIRCDLLEIDYDIADYALKVAEKTGIDYAEAYLRYINDYSYGIEQGIFNGGSYSESVGMRIRLIKKKRLYTFSTNILEKKNIEDAIKRFKSFKGVDTEMSKEPKLNQPTLLMKR